MLYAIISSGKPNAIGHSSISVFNSLCIYHRKWQRHLLIFINHTWYSFINKAAAAKKNNMRIYIIISSRSHFANLNPISDQHFVEAKAARKKKKIFNNLKKEKWSTIGDFSYSFFYTVIFSNFASINFGGHSTSPRFPLRPSQPPLGLVHFVCVHTSPLLRKRLKGNYSIWISGPLHD